jgi:Pvc16 N-terminal domain
MANANAIAAVGRSLERLLTARFAEAPVPVPGRTTRAFLVRTEDFDPKATTTVIQRPALSIFLYRVDFNKTMRAAWSAVGHQDGGSHLPVDLHFIMTAWAENAEHEHAILGRTMQYLDSVPVLSGPLLQQSGEWTADEAIQMVLEEIPTEAVMRTFDSLPLDYRLSVPYIARILRIDGRDVRVAPDVTTAIAGLVPGGRP